MRRLHIRRRIDRLSLQASVFSRYGLINFKPDPAGDLIFQGVAGSLQNSLLSPTAGNTTNPTS